MYRRIICRWLAFHLTYLCLLWLASGRLSGATWDRAWESGGLAYFFSAKSSKVERYNLASRQWMEPLAIPEKTGEITAAAVDADGLYVAFYDSVFRYNLSGGQETLMLNTAKPVRDLIPDGQRLIVNHSSSFSGYTILDKGTNTTISTSEDGETLASGAVYIPALHRLFGPANHRETDSLTYVQFDKDGKVVPNHTPIRNIRKNTGLPYRCWAFPDGGRVIDSNGEVYAAGKPKLLGNLGGRVDDVQFIKGLFPVVLRQGELHAYFPSLVPAGRFTLPAPASNIFQNGADILAFTPDQAAEGGVRVDIIPLKSIQFPAGFQANQNEPRHEPDSLIYSRDGLVYLYSEFAQSIFRWDPKSLSYLPRIPLRGVPDFLDYSDVNHAFYLAQDSGEVQVLQLGEATFTEKPLFRLHRKPEGLTTAGRFILAGDTNPNPDRSLPLPPGGKHEMAGSVYKVFSAKGQLLSTAFRSGTEGGLKWSEPARKMFYLRTASPTDIEAFSISAAGTLAEQARQDSPLHDSEGFLPPVLVAPNGKELLLGSGVFHDPGTLARKPHRLANQIDDAVWLADGLYTIHTRQRAHAYDTETVTRFRLQKWSGSPYTLTKEAVLAGGSARLLAVTPDRVVAVIKTESGPPSLELFDRDLKIVAPPVLKSPANLAVADMGEAAVTLTWAGVTGAESYVVQRKQGDNGSWAEVGIQKTGETTFINTGLQSGDPFFYRVLARNGALTSTPSAELKVDYVESSAPTGVVAQAAGRYVKVTWQKVKRAVRYEVEGMMEGESAFTKVGSVWAKNSWIDLDNLAPGKAYQLRVIAVTSKGQSQPSSPVTVMTTAAPAPPSLAQSTVPPSPPAPGDVTQAPSAEVAAAKSESRDSVGAANESGPREVKFQTPKPSMTPIIIVLAVTGGLGLLGIAVIVGIILLVRRSSQKHFPAPPSAPSAPPRGSAPAMSSVVPSLPTGPLPMPGSRRQILADAQGRPAIVLVDTDEGQIMVQRHYSPDGLLLREEATLNGQPVPVPPAEGTGRI